MTSPQPQPHPQPQPQPQPQPDPFELLSPELKVKWQYILDKHPWIMRDKDGKPIPWFSIITIDFSLYIQSIDKTL